MKLRFLKHPVTKQPDALLTMSCLVVLMCATKFMFEGIEVTLFSQQFSFGHADAGSYAAMLGPVLGAHGATEWKRAGKKNRSRVDDPDAECER